MVSNKLVIKGDENTIKKLMNHIKGDKLDKKGENPVIDFNKILPIPECLKISVNKLIETRVCDILQIPMVYKTEREASLYRLLDEFTTVEFDEEEYELFAQYINNYINIGYLHYDNWIYDKWGGRIMNCYNLETDYENEIYFITEFEPPLPLIKELSKQFPDLELFLRFNNNVFGGDECYSFINGKQKSVNNLI